MSRPYQSAAKYRIGEIFATSNPEWGRTLYQVMQNLASGAQILYRLSQSSGDERFPNRTRFYIMGGPGRPGYRKF